MFSIRKFTALVVFAGLLCGLFMMPALALDVQKQETALRGASKPTIKYDFVNGVKKEKYSDYSEVTGGTAPYKISSIEGDVPEGLSLKLKTSGRYIYLEGTPKIPGKYTFTIEVTDKNEDVARKTFTVIIKAPITVKPASISDGMAGSSYSVTLTAAGGLPEYVESSKYTWQIISGSLPDGLKFSYSNNTAKISGKPTKAGKFTFKVKVLDEDGLETIKQYSPTIKPKLGIVGKYTNGSENVSYKDYVYAEGGATPYKWTLESGKIPNGLTLKFSGNKANLQGKPSKGGTYTFTLKVTDKKGASVTKKFSVIIMYIDGKYSTPVYVGDKYSGSVTLKGGTAPYKWSKLSGAFPAGLTFKTDKAKASLSGTFTKAGKSSFTLKAVDGNNLYVTKSFTVQVVKPPKLNGSFSSGTVGAAYSDYVYVSDGVSKYEWTVKGKIPDGLKPAGYTGVNFKLTGKPTKAGTYNFTVTVKDKNGKAVSKQFSIVIAPKLSITGKFMDGVIGEEFEDHINVTGGASPYTWTKVSGTLPPGLKISYPGKGNECYITGTPTKTGKYNFTLKATDKNGASASKSFTVTIHPMYVEYSFKNGKTGAKYSDHVDIVGGTPEFTVQVEEGGTLPPGLNLSVSGRIIWLKGTPSEAGTYTFTLEVTDSKGSTAYAEFPIKINPAANNTALPTEKASESEALSYSEQSALKYDDLSAVEAFNVDSVPYVSNSEAIPAETEGMSGSISLTALNIASENILEAHTGKDSDLVSVRAYQPLRFIIGEWVDFSGVNVTVSDEIVYVDEKAYDVEISEDGIFTLPAEIIHDDFKVSVKAVSGGVELETEELYISAIE